MKAKNEAPLLTSNDIALAAAACSLAIAWHNLQPRSGFGAREKQKLKDLCKKLHHAGNHLNPFVDDTEAMPLDWGDDPIYGPIPKAEGQ